MKDNFEFHVTGLGGTTVRAGESIRRHIKVEVKDWDLLRSYFVVSAQLGFQNSIPGSHSLIEGLRIVGKKDGERIHETDFEIEFKIPKNFSGRYSVDVQHTHPHSLLS